MNRKLVLAICGSTRSDSSNLRLIKEIARLSKEHIEIKVWEGLVGMPQFNPDQDHDDPPLEVVEFREQLNLADGVLICTPEYAMGIPGALKNALDWTVSSCEFSHKPVAAITASSLGEKAHESLLGTLRILDAKFNDESQLRIPYIQTNLNKEGGIIDLETKECIIQLIHSFIAAMKNK